MSMLFLCTTSPPPREGVGERHGDIVRVCMPLTRGQSCSLSRLVSLMALWLRRAETMRVESLCRHETQERSCFRTAEVPETTAGLIPSCRLLLGSSPEEHTSKSLPRVSGSSSKWGHIFISPPGPFRLQDLSQRWTEAHSHVYFPLLFLILTI